MTDAFHEIGIESDGADAQAFVNGIEATSLLRSDDPAAEQQFIDEYLGPGVNSVDVFVHCPQLPERRSGPARVEWSVRRRFRDRGSTPEILVRQVVEALPGDPARLVRLDFSCDATSVRCRLMRDASAVSDLVMADRDEIGSLLTRFRAAMEQADVRALDELGRFRIAERARAKGLAFDELLAVYRESLATNLPPRGLPLEPREGAQLVFVVSGGNRRWTPHVLGSGAPWFTGAGQHANLRLPLSLARIEGRWTIVG